MSITIDRLYLSRRVPVSVKRAFYLAGASTGPEQDLFRDVAARAVLDAVGVTGLSEQPYHTDAIVEARQWFRLSTFDGIATENRSAEMIFDLAGLPFDRTFAEEVLAVLPPKKKRRRAQKRA